MLSKIFNDPFSVAHPFTVLPILGQIILVITLFQKPPSKTLIYISIGRLEILLLFMFIIGLMSFNYKIVLSVIPFIVVSILTVKQFRNQNGLVS